MIVEPVTAVTDYVIALECLLFAWLLLRFGWSERLWAAAFSSVAIAALLGGTNHGLRKRPFLRWVAILSGRVLCWLLPSASFLLVVAAAWRTPLGLAIELDSAGNCKACFAAEPRNGNVGLCRSNH